MNTVTKTRGWRAGSLASHWPIRYAARLLTLAAALPSGLSAQFTPPCCGVPREAIVRALITGDTVVLNEGNQYGVSYRDIRYVQRLDRTSFHVFEIAAYEAGHYMLVDPQLETQTYLDRAPVVSPNSERLATAVEMIGKMYQLHRIQIFRLVEDRATLEWECVTLDAYEPNANEWGNYSRVWTCYSSAN